MKINQNVVNSSHDFVSKYNNKVKHSRDHNHGKSIDVTSSKLKSLKKIIFMNKAVGVLG